MTLHAFDTTVERRGQEVTVTVPIYSTEPGVVTGSAPGCTFPDGNTKVIAGTRTHSAKNQMWTDGFFVPAAGAHAIRARDNCTIGFYLDTELLQNSPLFVAGEKHLVGSYKASRRINWHFYIARVTDTQVTLNYTQSTDITTNESNFLFLNRLVFGNKYRVLITLDGVTLTRYLNNNTAENTLTRTAPGAPGDDPYCRIGSVGDLYYWGSILSAGDIAAWMAGSATSVAPIVAYPCGEESSILTPFDASVNAYDGVFGLDAVYPASQIARIYTDAPGDPVVPASSIRVLVPAGVASPVTLTLTRPRQGVPSRASEAERFETTTGVITIVDIPAVVHVGPPQIVSARLYENPVAYCHITTDRPGTVIITCDRTIIDFPATVVVDASLEATMQGAILQGGDCTVTGTM